MFSHTGQSHILKKFKCKPAHLNPNDSWNHGLFKHQKTPVITWCIDIIPINSPTHRLAFRVLHKVATSDGVFRCGTSSSSSKILIIFTLFFTICNTWSLTSSHPNPSPSNPLASSRPFLHRRRGKKKALERFNLHSYCSFH